MLYLLAWNAGVLAPGNEPTKSKPCRADTKLKDSDSFFYQLTVQNFNYAQDICREFYIIVKIINEKCKCFDPRRLTPNLLKNFTLQFNLTICKTPGQFFCVKAAFSEINYDDVIYMSLNIYLYYKKIPNI